MMNLKSEATFFGMTSIILASTVCMNTLACTTPVMTRTPRNMRSTLFAKKKNKVVVDLNQMPKGGSGNSLENVFTGGLFEDDAASNLAKAATTAS